MSALRFVPKKMFFLVVGDALIITAAYLLALLIRFKEASVELSETEFVLLFVYLFVFYFAEFYDWGLHYISVRYVYRHLAGMTMGSMLVLSIFFLVPEFKAGRAVFLISSALIGLATLLWRFVFTWWYARALNGKKRVLIIGAGRAGTTLYNAIKNNPHYQMLGFMIDDDPGKWDAQAFPRVKGSSSRICDIVAENDVDIIVLAISQFKDQQLLKQVLDCKLQGVQIHDMPSFYEKVEGKVPVEHVTDFWLVFTPLLGVKKSVYNQKIKRVIDVVLSFFGLIFTLPLSAGVALAIKLESCGPALYRQMRVGLNGKQFKLVKFRSMASGTDHDRRFAGERNDPRITHVGRILRRLRLDELPQMWNVLKGDMSFIGPRALIPEEVKEFESQIPHFSLRHSIRPGITGWAQVKYKHGTKIKDGLEKLQYDLFYIKNLSPLLEFHILMSTGKVILSGKGAR